MSEHIPRWVFALFAFGSPIQELLNRWIPERFRSLFLWLVAGAIVGVAVVLTPLEVSAFNLQLALVYAALTSGWAMSNLVKPPLKLGIATVKTIAIVGGLSALALAFRAWAQVDSVGAVVDTLPTSVAPESAVPAVAAPAVLFGGVSDFIWSQVWSFLGAVLIRWGSKTRRAGG